jgi:hypothetical protein
MIYFQRGASQLLLLVIILIAAEDCQGFGSIKHLHAPSASTSRRGTLPSAVSTLLAAGPSPESGDDDSREAPPSTTTTTSRRTALQRLLATTTSAAAALIIQGAGLRPQPAWALKDRNEALCGTGFFTNIAQYKCTEIGDISDEGKSQPLSNDEEGSMQSLLSKMGMAEDTEDIDRMEIGGNEGERGPSAKGAKGSKENLKQPTR